MHLLRSLLPGLLLAAGNVALAASSWSFDDGTLSIQTKGAGVGGTVKEKLNPSTPLSKKITLGASDTLKILLTTTEGKQPKRPHQAFLTLTVPATGLQDSLPLAIKENGKAKVELTHKDLPAQFLASTKPIKASLVIASFGSSAPYNSPVFDLSVEIDPNAPVAPPAKALRYGKLPEIHHIFRADPKNPPKIITLFFTAVVLATLPALFGSWLILGGNINHLPQALKNAPISHVLFFGSIVALEGVFFMYYTCWNLFQTLPAASAVGVVTFLSGSKALTEVQERRLTGQR